MKKRTLLIGFVYGMSLLFLASCSGNKQESLKNGTTGEQDYHGFQSQVAWGEHLVQVSGCHDCHTPKMMTAKGPMPDTTRLLSGHPANEPAPDVNRKEMESKGLATTRTMTSWVGPWGISYAGNLTSDESGIGNWQESNFIKAIREGKYKGIDGSRTLLPPMPWQWYRMMSDEELKAIFAYLKTTKPVKNVVPSAEPPLAMQQ